jgi:TetR/AcrR family transcriptional regulator, cholesterol catabolism regulator
MASGIGRRRAAALADGTSAYAERRLEIIAAGAEVFREKGYRGAGLADIADRLGTDRASLYYYFGSKEELFHEIVRDASAANAADAEAIRDSEAVAPDKLWRLITSLMSSYAKHYPYLSVYIQEDLRHVDDGGSDWGRQMREINKRYDEAVVQIVQEGLDAGTIRDIGSARVIANGIIGMVNWSHRWFRDGAKNMPDAEQIGQTFARMALEGLSAR